MLAQNRHAPIDKLDVYPIDQQRSLAELNKRAKSPLARAPPAPRIARRQDHQQHSDTNQKKLGTRVPIVIDRIHLPFRRIQPSRKFNQNEPDSAQREENLRLAGSRPFTLQDESNGEPGKGKCRPRKNREKPGLWNTEVMHSIDVRLKRPRQPYRMPRGPQQRSQKRN